jgi:hypothetical protein
VQIVYLDDERAEPAGGSLGMDLTPREIGSLRAFDRGSHAVGRRNPSRSLEAEKDLTESSDMRVNLAAGAELHEMDVRLSISGGELRARGTGALKLEHWQKVARG